MENKPKKSRAIIITIILVLLLVLVGYLLFKRAGNSSSSNFFSRIFSSLGTSTNTKKENAQAGEDIKKGDSVSKAGIASNGSIVVVKSRNGSEIYGTANEDILNGEFGEILISIEDENNFLNSFSNFINNLFNGNDTNTIITPPGGDITPPGGDIIPPGGDITPPGGGEIIPKNYECSDTIDNDGDEKIDAEDPECHLYGDLEKEYLPEHNSESTTGGSGEIAPPDLISSEITPTNTTTNNLTTLSSTISNIGASSTNTSFYSFFTIKNITINDEQQIDTEKTNISKIKKFIAKITNKIPWVSSKKTIAEEAVELKVLLNPIPSESNTIASVIYTFEHAGTYSVRACADKESANDLGSIAESNENNNCGPWTTITVSGSLPTGGDMPQCSDTIDNDGDEKIDAEDPECHLNGDLEKEYLPEHNSESTTGGSGETLYQCNDLVDNDGDSKIDESDPGCHINGNLDNDYVPEHDSEKVAPVGSEENKCLLIEQNPLVFTDAEKAELADLLRKFYLIAPTLKTQDDIDMIYTETENYKNFITRLDDLTAQCYVESVDKNGIVGGHMEGDVWIQYSGPTLRYGNPWHKSDTRGSYIDNSVNIEKGYCSGDGDDGHSHHYTCSAFTTKWNCENHIDSNGQAFITGCNWTSAVNIKEYENILNIW